MSDERRIALAYRRLQLALTRAGYGLDGETLESAVTAAAKVVENRGDRDDFLPDCDTSDSYDHWFTEWRLNPLGMQREERFCFRCGLMETQEIRMASGENDKRGSDA